MIRSRFSGISASFPRRKCWKVDCARVSAPAQVCERHRSEGTAQRTGSSACDPPLTPDVLGNQISQCVSKLLRDRHGRTVAAYSAAEREQASAHLSFRIRRIYLRRLYESGVAPAALRE